MPGRSRLLDEISAFEERHEGTAANLAEKVRKRINHLRNSDDDTNDERQTLILKQDMLRACMADDLAHSNADVDDILQQIEQLAGSGRQRNQDQKRAASGLLSVQQPEEEPRADPTTKPSNEHRAEAKRKAEAKAKSHTQPPAKRGKTDAEQTSRSSQPDTQPNSVPTSIVVPLLPLSASHPDLTGLDQLEGGLELRRCLERCVKGLQAPTPALKKLARLNITAGALMISKAVLWCAESPIELDAASS